MRGFRLGVSDVAADSPWRWRLPDVFAPMPRPKRARGLLSRACLLHRQRSAKRRMDEPPTSHVETLRAQPLARSLWSALDRQLDGTLVLQEPNGEKHAIYLEQGSPAKVYSREASTRSATTSDGRERGLERRCRAFGPPSRYPLFSVSQHRLLPQLAPRERAPRHALSLLWARDPRITADGRRPLGPADLWQRHFFHRPQRAVLSIPIQLEDSAAVHAL